MSELFVSAFITLFVVIDPPGCAPIYAGLTKGASAAQARNMAIRACVIAAAILLVFALFGEQLLAALHIELDSFRIAGGLMLFFIAFEMVFEKRTQREATVEVRGILPCEVFGIFLCRADRNATGHDIGGQQGGMKSEVAQLVSCGNAQHGEYRFRGEPHVFARRYPVSDLQNSGTFGVDDVGGDPGDARPRREGPGARSDHGPFEQKSVAGIVIHRFGRADSPPVGEVGRPAGLLAVAGNAGR